MVTPTLLPLESESNGDLLEFARQHLHESEVNNLLKARSKIVDAVSSLTLVESRISLETQLPPIRDRFVNVSNSFVEPLTRNIEKTPDAANAFLEYNERAYQHIYNLVNENRDLLGEDYHERLLGALESSEGFDEWLLKTLFEPISFQSRMLLLTVGEKALFAQILWAAVMAILTDAVVDWRVESIPVLVEVFDDYMTSIEDVFLEQGLPLDSDDEAIPYDQVKESLGL